MQLLPQLTKLDRVVGVGQQVDNGGVRVSILSVELYEDGFLVHSRAQLDTGDLNLGRVAPRPSATKLMLQITDDRGGNYRAWPSGSGGSGKDYRWSTPFSPAVDSRARLLRIEAPAIHLLRHPEQESTAVVETDRPGPWVVEIPL